MLDPALQVFGLDVFDDACGVIEFGALPPASPLMVWQDIQYLRKCANPR